MKTRVSPSPYEHDGLPAQALASLNHAFRREFSSEPTRRERVRMEREHTRCFVDTRERPWHVDEDAS